MRGLLSTIRVVDAVKRTATSIGRYAWCHPSYLVDLFFNEEEFIRSARYPATFEHTRHFPHEADDRTILPETSTIPDSVFADGL
jgi:hypothetical protein